MAIREAEPISSLQEIKEWGLDREDLLDMYRNMLLQLELDPILTLGMRLGEASGGTVAIAMARADAACLSGMATFEEAGVSG